MTHAVEIQRNLGENVIISGDQLNLVLISCHGLTFGELTRPSNRPSPPFLSAFPYPNPILPRTIEDPNSYEERGNAAGSLCLG